MREMIGRLGFFRLCLVVGLLLTVAPSPAPANWGAPNAAFTIRAAQLTEWILQRTDYIPPFDPPIVLFLSPAEINYLHFSRQPEGYRGQASVAAVYLDGTGVVVLPDYFTHEKHDEFLVHELVHYLQDVSARTYACLNEREREAYELQRAFVEETGIGRPLDPARIAELTCNRPD